MIRVQNKAYIQLLLYWWNICMHFYKCVVESYHYKCACNSVHVVGFKIPGLICCQISMEYANTLCAFLNEMSWWIEMSSKNWKQLSLNGVYWLSWGRGYAHTEVRIAGNPPQYAHWCVHNAISSSTIRIMGEGSQYTHQNISTGFLKCEQI